MSRTRTVYSREYQRLYTPIRQEKDKVQYHIWNVCHKFRNRHFECERLKEIYR